MRLPFLRPKAEAPAAEAPKPKRARASKSAAVVDDVLDVEAARTQARRRLIGAVVLLVAGVLGFPLLFETQPRPLPMDTPMEAVRREPGAAGLVGREVAPPARSLPMALPPADAGSEQPLPASAPAVAAAAVSGQVVSASSPAPTPAPTRATVAATASAPAKASAATAVAKTASAAGQAASAPAKAATVPAKAASAPAKAASAPSAPPTKPAAESTTPDGAAPRFVVQAGAYKEEGKLREARSKIEGLGYKTYTQVVENDNGSRTRVRVGPFRTQEEADAVAARIKKSGLPAAIIKL